VTDGATPPRAGPGNQPEIEAHAHALRRGFAAGLAAWGDLGIAFDDYARGVIARVQARLGRAGIPSHGASFDRVLEVSVPADLYLAIACDAGAERAWSAFARELVPRIEGLARTRGFTEAESEELVCDLPGYLALPPPQGAARTRIGTFEGSCSLFSWLAVLVNRRWADRNRSRGRAEGPPAATEAKERSARLRTALASGFARLSSKEACAVRLKYVAGLKQKEVAALLGVKEPRISVLLKGAAEKLRAALGSSLRDESPALGPQDDDVWVSLRDAIGSQMEISTIPSDEPGRTS
jgi:predicted DNA-binding protein (UPF0251 family)